MPRTSGGYSGTNPSRQPAAAPSPPPRRSRVNQPVGYRFGGAFAPRHYYGKRHDYVFYPNSWTDTDTGTFYDKGYYDEDGNHYDDVSFAINGRYENVLCHCDYCGRDTLLNLDAAGALTDLKCPGCTAPLRIVSALDETDPSASGRSSTGTVRTQPVRRKKKQKWPWIVAILFALYCYGKYEIAKEESNTQPNNTVQQIQQIESDHASFGKKIRLGRTGSGSYTYTSSDSADKTLVWDADADSYYDASSDCWLWYNEDVDPAVWQYWYEGISSDFGDYGWMEHYSDGWFIEESEGNWIPLPEIYDQSGLWYIEG